MPLNIFLVEDNHTIQQSLVAALIDIVEANVVHIAAGEDEARAWLANNSGWQVTVVDLLLKQGSGLGVLESLKSRTRPQQVVVLSNYATENMKKRSLALGADAVFDKSTELDAFFDYCTRMKSDSERREEVRVQIHELLSAIEQIEEIDRVAADGQAPVHPSPAELQ